MTMSILECDHAAEMPACFLHIAPLHEPAFKHAAGILHRSTTQTGILKLLVTRTLGCCENARAES